MIKSIIDIKNEEINQKNKEIKKLEKKIKVLEQELELEKNKEIYINSSHQTVMEHFNNKIYKTNLMLNLLENDVNTYQLKYKKLLIDYQKNETQFNQEIRELKKEIEFLKEELNKYTYQNNGDFKYDYFG